MKSTTLPEELHPYCNGIPSILLSVFFFDLQNNISQCILLFGTYCIHCQCISKQCLRFSKPTLADLSAHGSSARQIPMKYAQQGNSSTLSFDIWFILNDFRLSYWHLLSLSFVLDEYFPLQVCVDGEAWVRRSLPAHNLLQLLGSQTSILCSDLFPNRPRLSASLWKVCAWSPDRRQTSNCLPPEPTGQFYCCLALYHSVFDIKLKYNCLFIWWLFLLTILLFFFIKIKCFYWSILWGHSTDKYT